MVARDLRSQRLAVGDLDTAGTAIATELDRLDPRPGLVLVQSANCLAAMSAVVGVLRSRHALLMAHPGLAEQSCAEVFGRVRPIARLVVDPGAGVAVVPEPYGPMVPLWQPPVAAPGLRLALTVLTSGTTQRPRLIGAPERQVVTATRLIAARLGYTAADVVPVVSPLSFDYGLYQLLLAMHARATVVLDPRLDGVAGLFMAITRGATVLPLVPPMLRSATASPYAGRTDTSGVRLVTTTGDLLTEADMEAARLAFPRADVRPMYGLSECKRVAITPAGTDRPPGAVGIALDETDVAVTANGARLPAGVPGELWVGGPHLTLGYLRDEVATARRFGVDPRSGRRVLRTGDRLRQDEDGWLHWVGRSDDVIKTSGYRVDPAEVETAAQTSGAVAEAAAFGRPDPARGQVPVLVVRLREGASEATLVAELARRLPRWALPEVVTSTKPLPRSDNGKIDRKALRGSRAVDDAPEAQERRVPGPTGELLAALAALPRSRALLNCHTQALLSAYTLPDGLSTAAIEVATTLPFGLRAELDDPTRLLIPFLDPDVGLDRAAGVLGLRMQTHAHEGPAAALGRLDDWLRTGPVLLGPLDLGHLDHHPFASTLHGCDHYAVAVGRGPGGGVVLIDPEGMALVELDLDRLLTAWQADAVPEGRGPFLLRRLVVGLDPLPLDLFARIAGPALDNLVAAAELPHGGPGGMRALARLRPDPTRQRGLCLLLPSAAARYRMASVFCAQGGAAWAGLAALLESQVHTLARAHGGVLAGVLPKELFERAAGTEEQITAVAAGLRRRLTEHEREVATA